MLKTLYCFVGLLGGAHVLFGLITSTQSEVARLWFVGSGLMIALSSLVGHSALVRLEVDRIASSSWFVVNLVVTGFVGYATLVLPEVQNFFLLLLMCAVTLGCAALVRSGINQDTLHWCCANQSATRQ